MTYYLPSSRGLSGFVTGKKKKPAFAGLTQVAVSSSRLLFLFFPWFHAGGKKRFFMLFHHFFGNYTFFNINPGRNFIHESQHQVFNDGTQTPGAGIAQNGKFGNSPQG